MAVDREFGGGKGPEPGNGNPLVRKTAETVDAQGRTHTTYTFEGGSGQIQINPRFGPDVNVKCPFLTGDDITFTVIEKNE